MGARNDLAKYRKQFKHSMKQWVQEQRAAKAAKEVTLVADGEKALYRVTRSAHSELLMLKPIEVDVIRRRYNDIEIREATEDECNEYALHFLSRPCSIYSL